MSFNTQERRSLVRRQKWADWKPPLSRRSLWAQNRARLRARRNLGINVVTKHWHNIARQPRRSRLRERTGDLKFQARGSQSLTASTLQRRNEIFYTSDRELPHRSELIGFASSGLGTNAGPHPQTAFERATRNIKEHAACASSENRDVAAHDLAIRRVHQLPGKCRCGWE
jgi:hypothetical protein